MKRCRQSAAVRREDVGEVPIDSGTLLLVDPCYILDDEFTGEPVELGPMDRPTYNACSFTACTFGAGDVGSGCVASIGDGLHPVFVEYLDDEPVRIVIELANRR